MNLTSAFRYLQGERRGMGSELRKPDPDMVALAGLLYPSISIQNTVRLADVSFWQDVIDFSVMRNAGIQGTIIRAGQRNWEDSKFKINWQKAKLAGLPRGTYWFYDSREDPKKQAALWWSLIKDDPGELVHCADLEESYGGPYGQTKHIKEFISEFQRLSGLPDDRIVIYTGHFWFIERVGYDIFFLRFNLWLAWYGEMASVRVPPPWHEADMLFWQYTGSGNGQAYGVSSREIDLNWYVSDVDSYKRRFGLDVVPPPPKPEEHMDYYEIQSNNTQTRSIRSGSSVKTPKLVEYGDLFPGKIAKAGTTVADVYVYVSDVVDSTQPSGFAARRGDTWRKVYDNDGHSVAGWIAKIHLGQVMITEVLKTDTPAIVLKHTVRVYSDGSIQVDDGPVIT